MLEAGSNSFELCTRLHALGLRAVVLESCQVGKHAKTYADNEQNGCRAYRAGLSGGQRSLCVGT